MKKILPLILFLLSITPILISDKFFLLKNPPVWPDEAIYFDTSKNLAETGNLSSNIFGGVIPGLEQHSAWYPPLFFYVEAFWINHFGMTIESIRLMSVIFSILSLGVIFLLIKKLMKSNLWSVFGVFLLSLDSSFASAGRLSRMDMMSFFLISLTLFLFVKALKNNKEFSFLWVGITSGLCLVTHPLGAIAPATAVVFLLLNEGLLKEKINKILLIVIPSIFAVGLWFFSMRNWFNFFIQQYALQFARKAVMVPAFFGDLSDRHWANLILASSIILIIFIYQNIKEKVSFNRMLILGLIISVVAVIWGKEGWYNLYIQPFMTLIIVSNLKQSLGKKLVFFSSLILTLFILLINFVYLYESFKNLGHNDYYAFGNSILSNLPQNSVVSESIIPDTYFVLIKGQKNITVYEFPTVPIETQKYKEVLDISDFLLINSPTVTYLQEYVQKNTASITQLNKGGYSTYFIRLVPKSRRI